MIGFIDADKSFGPWKPLGHDYLKEIKGVKE